MRTWGRIGEAGNPITKNLNLPSWALSEVTLQSGQLDPTGNFNAYALTATGSSPVATGPANPIPQNAGAHYGVLTIPVDTVYFSLTLNYLDAQGDVIASDSFSYDYGTQTTTSDANNGSILVVNPVPSGWYQATLTLPSEFSGNIVATQIEYWPVGAPPNVTASGSAKAFEMDYTTIPSNWVMVTTDANGYNDNVMLTTLAQVLKLNLGESPFYANYGIPQYQTITTQVFPDYYVMQTQTQFSQYFASLIITRVKGVTTPTYNIAAITHSGAILNATVAT